MQSVLVLALMFGVCASLAPNEDELQVLIPVGPTGCNLVEYCSDDAGCPGGFECRIITQKDGSVKYYCCPTDFWKELCDFENHIWRDYFRFMKTHKALVGVVPKPPGKSKIRKLLDQVWDDIVCINDLLCEVKDKKEEIKENKLDYLGIAMPRCLWRWIRLIMNKSDRIDANIETLKKLMKKRTQVPLLAEMQLLRANCLVDSIKRPLQLAYKSGHQIMLTLLAPGSDRDKPMCAKAEEMGLIYHKLLSDFCAIYSEVRGKLTELGRPELIPTKWFKEMAECIGAYADLYYEIRECCGQIHQFSAGELSKKVSHWLSGMMDLREQMRKCFPSKPGSAIAAAILKIDPESVAIQKLSQECGAFVNTRFAGVLLEFDQCVIEMRCLFLDFVEKFWQPPQLQLPGVQELKNVT